MFLFLVDILFLRRNCKANPNCFNCLGEKFWLGEIKGKNNLCLSLVPLSFIMLTIIISGCSVTLKLKSLRNWFRVNGRLFLGKAGVPLVTNARITHGSARYQLTMPLYIFQNVMQVSNNEAKGCSYFTFPHNSLLEIT